MVLVSNTCYNQEFLFSLFLSPQGSKFIFRKKFEVHDLRKCPLQKRNIFKCKIFFRKPKYVDSVVCDSDVTES